MAPQILSLSLSLLFWTLRNLILHYIKRTTTNLASVLGLFCSYSNTNIHTNNEWAEALKTRGVRRRGLNTLPALLLLTFQKKKSATSTREPCVSPGNSTYLITYYDHCEASHIHNVCLSGGPSHWLCWLNILTCHVVDIRQRLQAKSPPQRRYNAIDQNYCPPHRAQLLSLNDKQIVHSFFYIKLIGCEGSNANFPAFVNTLLNFQVHITWKFTDYPGPISSSRWKMLQGIRS
jgi:hypothetical protein